MNHVYWITGLSGAGKTTIGKLWYQQLKKEKGNVIFLDGDMLRQVFGDDLGYTQEDRKKSAMRNARLCAMLFGQGMDVVCCTISMFEEVREWNRQHIKGYVEVYVKVSMDTLCRRDQKGLYTEATQDVAGIHIQVEEPTKPDIVLYNDGEKTPKEQVEILNIWRKEQKGSCEL